MSVKKSKTQKLTLSAMLLCLATVLSFVKLLDLPYGGSITAASMLPVVLIGYLYGTGFGLLSSTCYSIIQLLLGVSTLSYATSALAAVAIILLDYIFAFAILGLSGSFKKFCKTAEFSLPTAAFLACILRYICHVISGCTVWAGLSIPTNQALIYSLGYNATYMLPETLVTVLAANYLARSLSFENGTIQRKTSKPVSLNLFNVLANGALTLGIITAVILCSGHLQNSETGAFDFSGLTSMNFLPVLLVLGGAIILFAGFKTIFMLQNKKACCTKVS